jgi:dTDP-4-amino-4,6-dideoxygalactose transaminase
MERLDVTRAFLPPKADFLRFVDQIWESRWLTNQGPLVRQLEQSIGAFLDGPPPQLVANGTLALQLAIRALELEPGEIVTTPFSYVATTSAIMWEGHQPVFADIDPATLCIDPTLIEAAITERTRAILPVHVFGTPCDVAAIQSIADRYALPVLYDGAHGFGVRFGDRALLHYGTLATCSFHATKLFNTVEGGCVLTADEELGRRIELALRFGHDGDDHQQLGINAKLSELHAAVGLSSLPFVPENIRKRQAVVEAYDEILGDRCRRPSLPPGTVRNYAYYPIILPSEAAVLRILSQGAEEQIFPRRYFYPSLNTLPYLKTSAVCPVSESVALRVLCLPLHPDLPRSQVQRISRLVLESPP